MQKINALIKNAIWLAAATEDRFLNSIYRKFQP